MADSREVAGEQVPPDYHFQGEGISVMNQIPPESLRDVVEAFRRYEREVQQSKLKPSTKKTYLLHAGNFVRWLKGNFTPGGNVGQLPGRPYNYWR